MFAVGRSKYAPGTTASFITSIIYIFFYTYQINILFLILCVSIIFTYSVYVIDFYASYFDEIDSKEIVIDEFVGQSIPILTAYSLLPNNDIDNFLLFTLLSFFLFRFFDILKPYPINKIDKNMKNGFGVMFDDVLAGVFSSIIVLIIILYLQYD
ncbi:phosphatidylglycerophosphatase A [Pelagibacteraceae bacterium]|nr:phosphatidylglycerophosphatase A [Pelagibacteraceae bacterium]